MDSIKIFSIINKKYVPYACVLISNIKKLASKDNKYEYIIVHNNMSKYAKEKIEKLSSKNFQVKTFNIAEYLSKFDLSFVKSRHGDETWYRLFAPDIFPQYNKIVFLDVDITVFDDIANLYNKNIENYEIAGAIEFFIIHPNTTKKYSEKYKKHLDFYHKNLQMYHFEKYFNAGVLVMNLDLMRKNNTVNNLIDLVMQYRKLLYVDQDILNKYYYDKSEKVKIIESCYNFLNPFCNVYKEFSTELYEQYISAKKNRKIIHYVSKIKPWNDWKCPNGIYWWRYGIRQPHLLLDLFKFKSIRKLKLTLLMLKCR